MASRGDNVQLKKLRADNTTCIDFEKIYCDSGKIVEDPNIPFTVKEESPTLENFNRATIEDTLETVVHEFQLEFELQPFQKEAIYQLVNNRNVILISPTGSGKTLVINLALRVKEMLTESSLVVLASEPTQNIIQEKLLNPILPSASVGMTGRLDFSEEKDVVLSHSLDDIKSGVFKTIYGYKESWSHPVGEDIIENFATSKSIGMFTYLI